MASPGTAFLLAYLPWRRLAHAESVTLLERNAATVDPQLRHAIDFLRAGLKVEERLVAEFEARLQSLPKADTATPAATRAGETARQVAIAASTAAHIAYLRCAASENADLREQADACARELTSKATQLQADLEGTGLPLAASHAGNVAKMIGLTKDLTPTTTAGYRQLNELARDVGGLLEATARHLDVPPPEKATMAESSEEQALFAKILATPGDHKLRLAWARLAEARKDPRAKLVRLQLAPIDDADRQKAIDLVRSHPEWTAPLQQLGASDVKFAGGFPDEITIAGAALLSHAAELFAAAPLTKVHVRDAKGKAGEIIRSPVLGKLALLDLDNQGVTDDDLTALAGSPNAAHLRQLDLRYNPISARGIEALAASPHLKQLEVVNLDGNPADPVDRLEYYNETNTELVPTDAGKALEAKYGPLRWLRRKA